jgi:hypothetical protein
MQAAEWNAPPESKFFTPQPPPPSQDLPEEPWLPARDVTLMTLVAYALIALLSHTEMFQ